MALKAHNPNVRVIGVESSDGPAMKRSVEAGHVVTLDHIDCIIDGLRVKRVGDHTYDVVSKFVDEIVTLPDSQIFDAVVWTMHYMKLVPEGAAAAPVGALLAGTREGTRRIEGRVRAVGRQRQSGSAQGAALELARRGSWFVPFGGILFINQHHAAAEPGTSGCSRKAGWSPDALALHSRDHLRRLLDRGILAGPDSAGIVGSRSPRSV
jgi:hypothetical protein